MVSPRNGFGRLLVERVVDVSGAKCELGRIIRVVKMLLSQDRCWMMVLGGWRLPWGGKITPGVIKHDIFD